ncbi:MAG: tetratricopeptide repeat protein [Planctomycetota bacterium]|nr:tetratricopeptide repeat protein [Planctomycetota bacterium]
MARSPDKAEDTSEEYGQAWAKVLELIRAGQSWSGKERHCIFLNTGTSSFADASAVSGLDFADDGRGLAPVDWDGDGDLDLWFTNRTGPRVRFLLNNSENNERYISFRLTGTGANRDAIGAEVELHLMDQEDRRYVRSLKAGSGFISQGSKWVHFGLPADAEISSVTVRWPGGEAKSYSGVHAGARWEINEAIAAPKLWSVGMREMKLADGALPSEGESATARIPVIAPLPLLGLAEELPDGTSRPIETRSSGGLLITLWAGWCANCKRELNEMSAAADELSAAGVRILALNVDEPSERVEADSYLTKINWPFERANADSDFLSILETAQKTLSARPKPEVIPTSYLLDNDGRLQFIYRGPVSPEQVIKDSNTFGGSPSERRDSFGLFPGWWSSDIVPTRYRKMAINLRKAGHSKIAAEYLKGITLRGSQDEAPESAVNKIFGVEVNTGSELLKAGNVEEARQAFARAVKLKPNSAEANKLLGVCLQKLGLDTKALPHLKLAARQNPSDAETQNDLGLSLVKTGATAKAAAAFKEAIKLDPTLAKAHLNLGVYHAQNGRFDEALASVAEAAKLSPDYFEAWVTLAQLHNLAGRHEETQKTAKKAWQLNKASADALYLNAHSLSQLGRKSEAAALLPALRRIAPAKAAQIESSL